MGVRKCSRKVLVICSERAKKCGVQLMLIACVDACKGFADTINAVYLDASCIVYRTLFMGYAIR
ncbi:MAG: hypothetical protein ACI9WS_001335 [Paraglaciecola psychrophila]|jgi:hypothetical protein